MRLSRCRRRLSEVSARSRHAIAPAQDRAHSHNAPSIRPVDIASRAAQMRSGLHRFLFKDLGLTREVERIAALRRFAAADSHSLLMHAAASHAAKSTPSPRAGDAAPHMPEAVGCAANMPLSPRLSEKEPQQQPVPGYPAGGMLTGERPLPAPPATPPSRPRSAPPRPHHSPVAEPAAAPAAAPQASNAPYTSPRAPTWIQVAVAPTALEATRREAPQAQVTSPACSGYAPGGSPQARPPQSEPSAGRYGGRGVVRFAV